MSAVTIKIILGTLVVASLTMNVINYCSYRKLEKRNYVDSLELNKIFMERDSLLYTRDNLIIKRDGTLSDIDSLINNRIKSNDSVLFLINDTTITNSDILEALEYINEIN